MELDKAVKERRSVRNFKKTKKVSYKDVISVIECGIKAPLAGNIYCLKYILVSDKEKIKQLAAASQQDFFEDVDFVIVVCSDISILKKHYYDRSLSYLKQEAGASIEHMLLKVADLGLSSCWVGAFSDEEVKRVLEIPDNIEVEAILPVGYELGKTKQLAKPDLDNVLFFDFWKNKFQKPRSLPGETKI